MRQGRAAQGLQVVTALERGDNPAAGASIRRRHDGAGGPGEVLRLQSCWSAQRIAGVGVEAGRDQDQVGVERRPPASISPSNVAPPELARRARRHGGVDDVADARSRWIAGAGPARRLVDRGEEQASGRPRRSSWVPLPWWTSKSTTATRVEARGLRARARRWRRWSRGRSPSGAPGPAWWPGGRTAQNARCASSAATRPHRRGHRAGRAPRRPQSSPARARCPDRAAGSRWPARPPPAPRRSGRRAPAARSASATSGASSGSRSRPMASASASVTAAAAPAARHARAAARGRACPDGCRGRAP